MPKYSASPKRSGSEDALIELDVSHQMFLKMFIPKVQSVQHEFWGFTRTGGTVKKAVEALADHLTNYLPVNRETFEELFGREYDNGGEYWEKLRKGTFILISPLRHGLSSGYS